MCDDAATGRRFFRDREESSPYTALWGTRVVGVPVTSGAQRKPNPRQPPSTSELYDFTIHTHTEPKDLRAIPRQAAVRSSRERVTGAAAAAESASASVGWRLHGTPSREKWWWPPLFQQRQSARCAGGSLTPDPLFSRSGSPPTD